MVMSQNASIEHTDGKQIEMLIDDLLTLYRELRKTTDKYSDLRRKGSSNEEEVLNTENGLMELKSVFEKGCNAAFFTLYEVKNRDIVSK
jgi:hypothetical protein